MMMPQKIHQRQLVKSFIWQVVSFVAIFSVLGTLVYWTYARTVYDNADATLLQQSRILMAQSRLGPPEIIGDQTQRNDGIHATFTMDGSGRVDTLLFNDAGELVNENDLKFTNQYALISGVKLVESNVGNAPETMKIGANYYRVQTIALKNGLYNNAGSQTADYAIILKNFTDGMTNMQSFSQVLWWTFALFGLLALAVSYGISRLNMRPILHAWQQQQDFVDSAAHELRTPLAVVQGKLETLLTNPQATVREQANNVILSLAEIRRLNSLTSNMLTLAKTGSAMTKIEKEPTEMHAFLAQISEPYQELAQAEEKHLQVQVDVDQHVNLDQKRVHQLLVLLLDNAIKYTDVGDTLTLRAFIERRRLILSVADTGIGISDDGKKHVFDRFYREDKTGSRETGGTGLGLSIAEWIVEAHDGKITVTDNQPKGTVFTVSLPL